MTGLELAVWGALGGVAVELLELQASLKRLRALPWGKPGYLTFPAALASFVTRIGLGVMTAVATGYNGQINGPLAAFGAGIAAPLLIEKIGQVVVLGTSSNEKNNSAMVQSPSDTDGRTPLLSKGAVGR